MNALKFIGVLKTLSKISTKAVNAITSTGLFIGIRFHSKISKMKTAWLSYISPFKLMHIM